MKKQLIRLVATGSLALTFSVGAAIPASATNYTVPGVGAISVTRQIQGTGNAGGGTVTTSIVGDTVTLTAVAARGFSFAYWDGSGALAVLNNQGATAVVEITGAVNASADRAVAVFAPTGVEVYGSIVAAAGVGGTATVQAGQYLTSLLATPTSGCFVFSHWVTSPALPDSAFVHGTTASSVTASVATPAAGTVTASPVFIELTTGACGPAAVIQLPDTHGADTYGPDTIVPGAGGAGGAGVTVVTVPPAGTAPTPGAVTPGTGTLGTGLPGTGVPGTPAGPGTPTGPGLPDTGTPPGTGTPAIPPGTGAPEPAVPVAPDFPITGQPTHPDAPPAGTGPEFPITGNEEAENGIVVAGERSNFLTQVHSNLWLVLIGAGAVAAAVAAALIRRHAYLNKRYEA